MTGQKLTRPCPSCGREVVSLITNMETQKRYCRFCVPVSAEDAFDMLKNFPLKQDGVAALIVNSVGCNERLLNYDPNALAMLRGILRVGGQVFGIIAVGREHGKVTFQTAPIRDNEEEVATLNAICEEWKRGIFECGQCGRRYQWADPRLWPELLIPEIGEVCEFCQSDEPITWEELEERLKGTSLEN